MTAAASATSATSAAFATATPPLPCLPLEGEWIERLASAHTEADLLDVVRGFVSSWHPASLALIPAEARPLRLITREDIAFWAYELACARLRPSLPHDVDEWVTRMHAFFSQAAARAAMLAATSSKA